jgi:tRNA threonylcarbamoyladenosine biosynthesis protein TsaB
MLQLALDCSTSRPTVALIDGEHILTEWLGQEGQHHSASLLAGIDHCLENASKTLRDLKFISVGVGPGMFTGLRIGVASAQFLADMHQLSVAPVSSLRALALAAENEKFTGRIWALNDARSQRVYALPIAREELYSLDFNATDEEIALPPTEVAAQIKAGDFLLGEGAQVFKNEWPKEAILAPLELHILQARYVGKIGAILARENKLISPKELQPKYLKTGQAHLP